MSEPTREMLEPCGGFNSKLEWLAVWLDGMDSILEGVNGEPLGHAVQDDLRRWARELREQAARPGEDVQATERAEAF